MVTSGRRPLAVLLAVATGLIAVGVTTVRLRSEPPRSVALDRDGDRRADPIVWQPSTGRWRLGSDSLRLGGSGGVPVPADWDGDGLVDAGLWRPDAGVWELPGRPVALVGFTGDVPVPCDFDGDGDLDPAVWRPETGVWFGTAGALGYLGGPGDIPVPGPWSGRDACDLAVFRDRDGTWSGTGKPDPFGLPGDVPVPGDWDGDGDLDRAVWRPATGAWLVEGGRVVSLGLPTDEPAPADWDGDGALNPAVWRPDEGSWYLAGDAVLTVGSPGDEPLVLAPAVRVLRHPPGSTAATTTTVRSADSSGVALSGALSPPDRFGLLLVVVLALFALRDQLESLVRGLTLRRPAAARLVGEQSPATVLLVLGAATLPLGTLRVASITVADAFLVASLVMRVADSGIAVLLRAVRAVPEVMCLGGLLAITGGILGGVLGTDGAIGWRALARAAVGVTLPLAAVLCERDSRRPLVLGFAVGAAGSVLAGLSEVAGGARLAGFATHPNHLGLTALLGVAMATSAFPRWKVSAPLYVLVAVNIIGVVLSGSRAALLGLFVLGAWSLLRTSSRGGPRAWLAVVATLLVAPLAMLQRSAVRRLAGDAASDQGHRFRLDLALERIRRAPLTGEGFRFLEEAHNVPLQLMASGGVLTLVGGGLLLGSPLVIGYGRRLDPVARWLTAGWAAYLSVGLVQNMIVDRYVWFLAALILMGQPAERGNRPLEASPTGPAQVVLLAPVR